MWLALLWLVTDFYHVLWSSPSQSPPWLGVLPGAPDRLPFASCETQIPVTILGTLGHHHLCTWAVSIWSSWFPSSGLSCHPLSLRGILLSPELFLVQVIGYMDIGCLTELSSFCISCWIAAIAVAFWHMANLDDKQCTLPGEWEFRILQVFSPV